MFVSKACESFEVLILGRLVFGLFCGLVMSLNPLYIQEVSPTKLRGAFATLNQVSLASGTLVGMVRTAQPIRFVRDSHLLEPVIVPLHRLLQVVGLEAVLGTEDRWAMMLSLSLIPALTQYLLLPFCPESPRYLLINRGEEQRAKAGQFKHLSHLEHASATPV